MKSVTTNAAAQVSQQHGTEPLIIIGIEWSIGTVTFYADKDIPGAKSKILSIGTIEAIAKVSSVSQSVNLTLDDTDGEIKTIIDSQDIHKVSCSVYQYYGALNDLSDMFLIFKGKISTPFAWSEKERSITFSIVSEIENYEVGFSPEEGQLGFVNDEYVGKSWPLCFGNVVYVPAQKVSQALEGQLLDTICVVDELLYHKKEYLRSQYWEQAFLMKFFTLVANGAELYAPSVSSIITEYIRQIVLERQSIKTINTIVTEIARIEKKIAGGKATAQDRTNLKTLKDNLKSEADKSHQIQVKKAAAEEITKLADFKYRLQKDAFLKIADAYSAMQQILADYTTVQTEICNQNECVVSSVRVQNGSNFPQNEDISLYVKDVRFFGKMIDDVFTLTSPSPKPKYGNLAVESWTVDDDPCAPADETNGVNMFRLAESPPVNIVGMWAFVTKRTDGTKHVIKIERQSGRKVYFSLVRWYGVEGQPEGLSIDNVINELVSTPFINLPIRGRQGNFGGNVGVPQSMMTGDWATSAWNSPEGAALLNLINRIPGGVNAHELQVLARLVFLAPTDRMNGLAFTDPGPRDIYTIIGEDVGEISAVSAVFHKDWLSNIPFEELPDSAFWQAEVGSMVRISPEDKTIYVANILPSTIKAVHAYRTLDNGSRILSPVPSSYYLKNESASLGTIDVTALYFKINPKNIPGEGWEDDIYVTLNSTVGPDVPDIIQWLIETYSNLSVNASNFTSVKSKLANYPANFALIDQRPNVLQEVERIAFESRCAVYRVGDEIFLKYLSEEPTQDVTFTEDNIAADSHLDVSFPETENLVTKLTALWRAHYLPLEPGKKPNKLVIRNNIGKYGLHTEEIDFHIYNDKKLVSKSATFWLIRYSNTWKYVVFKTFLDQIRLDPYDTIQFAFSQDYISSEAVKGVIKSIFYNTDDNLLELHVELPIRAGEMVKYPFYWAGSANSDAKFTPETSSGPGSGVTGTIEFDEED